MKKISFITQNKFKFQEMNAILRDYGIELEQLDMGYEEDKEAGMKEVCIKAAKLLADQLGKAIIVEDTGLFFKAYNNFPGALPKFVINGIGFDGIFRLLDGKDRSAYFKTVIGYCEPRKEPVTFEDEMLGAITDKIILPEVEAMPYDHIFIPKGRNQAIVEMDMQTKNSFSQRGKVTRKLGEYLQSNS